MVSGINFSKEYKLYKQLLKSYSKNITNDLGQKVTIVPTSKKICRKNGIADEAANSINTADFIKAVYMLLKAKGYRIPKLYIDESQLPRKYNMSGLQMGNWNIFGPGRLDVSSPSLVIHEEGHYLHNKNMKYNQTLYAMFNSFRSLFRPFLNKSEKNILKNDFKRAYNEGYFSDLQLDKCLSKGYIDKNTLDDFYNRPEYFLSKNAFSCVEEFIAEYFTLASRGFKFSPEITKRYNAFHGPEIKDIVTNKETNELMKFKNRLEQRTKIDVKDLNESAFYI